MENNKIYQTIQNTKYTIQVGKLYIVYPTTYFQSLVDCRCIT